MTSESYFLLAQAYLNGESFAEAGTAIQMAIQFQESNCEYNYLAAKIQLRSAGVHTAPDNSSCPQGR
jgi:cytochrome c-type biogenesis protein CcmH/NrfG